MKAYLAALGLQAGQHVLSVGCGGGLWEIGLAVAVPGLSLWLLEQHATLLNAAEVAAAVGFWEKNLQVVFSGKIQVIIQDSPPYPIPEKSIDKLLIFNVLHEMPDASAVFCEAARLLRPSGDFWLEEPLARFGSECHEGCGKRLLQATDLDRLAAAAGFCLSPQTPLRPDAAFFRLRFCNRKPDSTDIASEKNL